MLGKSMENCLLHVLTKEGDSERHCSTCSIDQQPNNHADVNNTKVLPLWLGNCRIKLIYKVWKSSERLGRPSLLISLSFYRCSLAQVLSICNHACPFGVSYDCLLTCDCVKGAAISICNARPHQCLMQSPSLFHFSPALSWSPSLYLWKQPAIWYWSATCC